MSRHTYVERAPSPADYCRLFTETFGPLVPIRHHLEDAPQRRADLDRALLEAVIRWNQGRSTGPVEIPYEYCSSSPGARRPKAACRKLMRTESTVRFCQEVFDSEGRLREVHEKYWSISFTGSCASPVTQRQGISTRHRGGSRFPKPPD